MTVICDQCGKSYLAARVVGASGQILKAPCPHCGNPLWSGTSPRTRGDEPPPRRSRGFS